MNAPLTVEDLLAVLRQRWGVSWDLHIIQRQNRVYLQVMWCYLEQQVLPPGRSHPTGPALRSSWRT